MAILLNLVKTCGSVPNAQLEAIIVAQPYLILPPLPYPLRNAVMSVYHFSSTIEQAKQSEFDRANFISKSVSITSYRGQVLYF